MGSENLEVDVRVVTATNRNLEKEVREAGSARTCTIGST